VSALAHRPVPYQLVGRSADLGFVTPFDAADARRILGEIRAAQASAGRAEEILHVVGDVVVFLDDDPTAAADRKARLDELAGEPLRSDALVFTGTPAELADLVLEWQEAGLSGARLRPGVLPHDLAQITGGLVPELQQRGAFRTAYEADTLRGLLGMARPANRYAAV
jgi:alkanesulfonate monooxygenase SsuD/methylene tetrahydromethanopterin reductase-like flavin-dependent oxidoreductase (luciferase family)